MKAFDDLSETELLALTEADIERYIDLACAEEGIPLLPLAPPTLPERSDISADLEVFHAGGILFQLRAEAEAVADLASRATRYTLNYIGNDYRRQKAVRAADPVTVTSVRYHSEDLANRNASALEELAAEKDRYEKERASYDRIVQQRADIRRPMREKIRDARGREFDRARLRREYARYLELADNGRRTAARFLEHAFPEAKELLPDAFVFSEADQPDIVNPRRSYSDNQEGTARAEDPEIAF